MSTFILIHGSWHGAWCWYKVFPRLQRAGHTVIAFDLPGHGRDHTPPGEITMQDYVDAVGRALDACDEPAVLVAHSRGGIVASQAAEASPDRLSLLVYLAAYLVPDGQTVVPLALSDSASLVIPNLDIDREGGWDMLRRHAYGEALYADCSHEDIALAHALLTPEPIAPTNTALRLTAGRFGSVPRTYIELTEDRAVSLMLQRHMQQALPCLETVEIEASHSAYFSRPDELTSAIIGLAERHARVPAPQTEMPRSASSDKKASSSRTVVPSASAFASLEPGSAPQTR